MGMTGNVQLEVFIGVMALVIHAGGLPFWRNAAFHLLDFGFWRKIRLTTIVA